MIFAGSQLGVISAASTSLGSQDLWVRDVWADHGPVELVAGVLTSAVGVEDDLAAERAAQGVGHSERTFQQAGVAALVTLRECPSRTAHRYSQLSPVRR